MLFGPEATRREWARHPASKGVPMKRRLARFVVGAFFLGACGVVGAVPDASLSASRSPAPPDAAQAKQRIAGLTVPFTANTGGEDARVAYSARTLGGTLFVT